MLWARSGVASSPRLSSDLNPCFLLRRVMLANGLTCVCHNRSRIRPNACLITQFGWHFIAIGEGVFWSQPHPRAKCVLVRARRTQDLGHACVESACVSCVICPERSRFVSYGVAAEVPGLGSSSCWGRVRVDLSAPLWLPLIEVLCGKHWWAISLC